MDTRTQAERLGCPLDVVVRDKRGRVIASTYRDRHGNIKVIARDPKTGRFRKRT